MTCVLEYGHGAPATMDWFGVQDLDGGKVRRTGPPTGHRGVKLFLKPSAVSFHQFVLYFGEQTITSKLFSTISAMLTPMVR